jgi:hypothetical protein
MARLLGISSVLPCSIRTFSSANDNIRGPSAGVETAGASSDGSDPCEDNLSRSNDSTSVTVSEVPCVLGYVHFSEYESCEHELR